MTILITGAAGFIGFHLSKRLLLSKSKVIGFDNINNYYDSSLKKARLENLHSISSKITPSELTFFKGDLENIQVLNKVFEKFKPSKVVNFAAQAGVRSSISNPNEYIQANLVGFANILECCRNHNVKHLVYASSSSVYGGNKNMPFSVKQGVDHPVSLYAATKKSNELMAHAYSHLYQFPSTGLRFFTVYGPWGRPDMALFLFTKKILNGEPIQIFNNGEMLRDFTYIDDIIESLIRIIKKPAESNKKFNPLCPDPSSSWAPHKVFNIGNSNPTKLMDYVKALEKALKIKAKKEFLPMQPGDVKATYADTQDLENWIDFKPNTSIEKGINEFVLWYKDFYNI